MARGNGKSRRINEINRYIVQAIAIKNHQNVKVAQREFKNEVDRVHRANGRLMEDFQFKPLITKKGVTRKTHEINRYIIRLTAIKNDESVDLAQKEYTQKIQREYRARKLRAERQRKN